MLPKNGDFSELLGAGENPSGMVAHTPNGTIYNGKGGDGCQYFFGKPDSARWNHNPLEECPPLMEGGFVQVTAHRRRG